jgi:hypothetical protein
MSQHKPARLPDQSINLTVIALMVLAGAASGAASAIFPDSFAKVLNPVSKLFMLDGSAVHPGLFYGSAIALILGWLGERRIWALVLTVIVVSIAWSAAVNAAIKVYDIKDLRTLYDANASRSAGSDATAAVKLLTGFVAGIVGAFVMVAGLAISIPPLRKGAAWAATTLVGGVAGLLIYPFLAGWNETAALILLFAVWQASVGASIGIWVARRRWPGRTWPNRLGETTSA